MRLRDVAAHAQVALGTLYRRFRSKEDLLIAALALEYQRLDGRTMQKPPQGDTPLERVLQFFAAATRTMTRRPNLTRAAIRAVASGEPKLTKKVASLHEGMAALITMALREPNGSPDGSFEPPTPEEMRLAFLLQQIWFAALVGWAGGMHGQGAVLDQMRFSAALILRGAEADA